MFESSDAITATTGSSGIYPSFKGTIGSLVLYCNDFFYGMVSDSSETKLKGLWYFDENSLPRPNLANPYNLEPKFAGHAINPPVWDTSLNRWRVHNGGKFVLEIGNFLDFKPSEVLRTISLVIDFKIMTPLAGSLGSGNWYQFGTLSSDIEITMMFYTDGTDYAFSIHYRDNNGILRFVG